MKAFLGLVWQFLDGWKTWIWAVVVAAKMWWPDLGVWTTVDSLAAWAGWSNVNPAVDPGQLVQWVTFAIAVGHKFLKAVQEYNSGVPVVALLTRRLK